MVRKVEQEGGAAEVEGAAAVHDFNMQMDAVNTHPKHYTIKPKT